MIDQHSQIAGIHKESGDRIVGRRVDESNPMVDARLADGSRVNAIIPPLAVDGPLLSIRRFGTDKLMPADLVKKVSLTPGMMQLLEAAVKARLNIIAHPLSSIRYKNVVLGPQDPTLFIYPKSCQSAPQRARPKKPKARAATGNNPRK